MVTAFVGAALFDGHRHHPPGRTVVVDGGRIVAVGDVDVPTGARVVDCAGGLVAPGFVDAHVHAVQGGLERIRCDLTGATTKHDYLALIADFAASHPELPWVLGGGWAMGAFPGGTPTAADLDTVVADRPVFLPNRDHHGAWVNTRALELAGIDRHSPDPPHGRIERDADGSPSGTLHEAAMALVADLVPATSPQEQYDGLLAGQRYLHSLGVTGWQDAIVGGYAGMDDPGPTYLRAAAAGDLTAHVVGALWWQRDLGLEQVPSLVERRQEYSRGRFRATSVKIMQDGVMENFTAGLLEPYLDPAGTPTADVGRSFVDPATLTRAVAALDQAGFQVHVHAIGDRAVREALDAFAGVAASPRRHHIAHVQLVHPDDVVRFAELGVSANIQALWAQADTQMVDLTVPFLGEERASWQYPFAALHRAGARLVAGSDWPVSTPDPPAAMHVAVNRRAHGADGVPQEPFLPEQALTLEAAFAAYTSGSAWINHRDDAGSLADGRAADLVLLDRDPFAGEPEDIGATSVVGTWVEGHQVFSA